MEGIVTYELVEDAIEKLLATKEKVTLDSVRIQLGNIGSRTTINKHVRKWREAEQLKNISIEKLPERTKNILSEKLQNQLEDQKYILEQTRKRCFELEQKSENLVQENNKLKTQQKTLESELKNKEQQSYKQDLEIRSLEKILAEVRYEHKANIKFLEDNVSKISNLASTELSSWRDKYHELYDRYQEAEIDHKNEILHLKSEKPKNDGEQEFVIDNLMREVGRLKRELKEKEASI